MSEPEVRKSPDPEAVARALAASAPHEPTGDVLNLSRRPFLNSRPVIRTALLLWLAGALLLAINVSSFWDYLSGSADKRARIQKGEEDLARRDSAVRQLEVRLDAYDLTANNEKVDFLNEKILQRTFSWSLLLERLGDVLPNDVRLLRLQPGNDDKGKSRTTSARLGRATSPNGAIPLSVTGQAKSFEALLKLQSNLFAHPAFGSYPNVSRESRDEDNGNLITFELTAQYVPGSTPTLVPAAPPKAGGAR